MSKLEITEIQIDSFNEIHNMFLKLSSGLNVISGSNETGKTTLMSFIKNIFLRKRTEAKGYLKCAVNGLDIHLVANKNKLKENEQYLERITPHRYKTGFVITLDDLNTARKCDTDELINTIKDSSGNDINKKQDEYYEFIYGKKQPFSLTSTSKATKTFLNEFEKLKNIEKQINELQLKEDDYNKICYQIKNLEKDIKEQNIKISCAQILLKKRNTQEKLNNIVINGKLLANKAEFEKIRESFGALSQSRSKLSALNSRLADLNPQYSKKYNELDKLEHIDDIETFVIAPEYLKLAKQLMEKEKDITMQENIINQHIQDTKESLKNLEENKSAAEKRLAALSVKNIEEYINDKIFAESSLHNYSNLLDKYRLATDGAVYGRFLPFIFIFAVSFCLSAGSIAVVSQLFAKYLFSLLVFISLAGIICTIREFSKNKSNTARNNLKEELVLNKSAAVKIFNEYGFEITEERDFTAQSNCIIQKMNSNITEYDSLFKELFKLNEEYNKQLLKLNKLQGDAERLALEHENLAATKKDFLKKAKVSDIGNYAEIYEYLRELKLLNSEIKSVTKEINNIDKSADVFFQNLNNFIKISELDIVCGRYDDFEAVTNKIRDILDENLENNRLLSEILAKISAFDNEIKAFPENLPVEIKEIDEAGLQEMKKDFNILGEKRGMLLRSKEILESESALIELKNIKNAEIARIKLALDNLAAKEVVYNTIKAAKEKFNEIQPNLVSAKKYLEKITNDKYCDIDFETRCISGRDIGDKDWEILSRGTKEQLYLAFRLGYASNYSKDKNGAPNGLPDLPLIIDDAFVNFDEARTASALKCLEEFAKTNQVLFFTCHNKFIKEILKKHDIKHNLIDLVKAMDHITQTASL